MRARRSIFSRMGRVIHDLERAWMSFWFESSAPRQLSAFRAVFGVLLFTYIATRTPDLMFLYSESGILPTSMMPQLMEMGHRTTIFRWFPSDTAIWGLHFAFLGSLLSMALGFFPRLSAAVAFILHVSFLHRNMAGAYGMDSISTFFLLNLALADSRQKSDMASVALRFSQLQVCIIYFYSGLEKLKGAFWWKGEAVWTVMANSQLASSDFSWLAGFPMIVAIATWSTLLWEVYFPVLVWIPRLRYPVLLFGVALHLGIGLSMNIPFFGFLMISSYLLFLPEGMFHLDNIFKSSGWKKTQGSPQ
jgi:hypothetical protein